MHGEVVFDDENSHDRYELFKDIASYQDQSRLQMQTFVVFHPGLPDGSQSLAQFDESFLSLLRKISERDGTTEEEKKEEQSVQLYKLQSQGGYGNVQSTYRQLVFVVGKPPAELFENRFLSW